MISMTARQGGFFVEVSMADFILEEDHSDECLSALDGAVARALEIVGEKVEGYAIQLAAPLGPKGRPFPSDLTSQIRNSIGHKVEGETVSVGSNLDIAAYVELGTSKEYDPPPEWMENQVEKGPHSGLDHWFFFDEDLGRVRIGLPMKPTPFLRPAVERHKDEYEHIIENELKNA